jgi:hypothetical protein
MRSRSLLDIVMGGFAVMSRLFAPFQENLKIFFSMASFVLITLA